MYNTRSEGGRYPYSASHLRSNVVTPAQAETDWFSMNNHRDTALVFTMMENGRLVVHLGYDTSPAFRADHNRQGAYQAGIGDVAASLQYNGAMTLAVMAV